MDNKTLVISFFKNVYNNKDLDLIMEIFDRNYYEHTKNGARSNKDCRDIIEQTCAVFPDLHVEVEEILSGHGIVATRLTFTGTQSGEFLGMQPTQKKIGFEAMEFFKIENGLIKESWGSWPIFDIIEQLDDEKK